MDSLPLCHPPRTDCYSDDCGPYRQIVPTEPKLVSHWWDVVVTRLDAVAFVADSM